RRTRRVDVEQLGGHLEELFLDARLALQERLAFERIELRLGRIAADVLLDLAQPVDGQVKAVLAGELQEDEVGREATDGQAREAVVARDPVLDVHDEVAFLQVAEIGGFVAEGSWPPRSAARARAG